MVLTNKIYLKSCKVVVKIKEEILLDRRLYVNISIYLRRTSCPTVNKGKKILINDIIKRKLPWC